MKRKINIVFSFFLLSFLISSCDKKEKDKTTTDEVSYENSLTLNNGEKWLANKETTVGMENMAKLVAGVIPGETDAKALAESLEMEFKLIVSKCTMTGEPHDQLHYYILPLKDKIDALKSSDESEKKAMLEDITSHIKMYKTYFK
ncbi:hypothetical protein [Spongiivirga citrea]|uniref:Lipoprotein n=1 Tax=Spongiivirga citrea TaxID=1481457 RepID=A0A6M0CPW1_9FLAO|nr:hypothetical protein [Spongiivirga citrea]NER18963.1 hypothetical protein [Spongiivirga citrea]